MRLLRGLLLLSVWVAVAQDGELEPEQPVSRSKPKTLVLIKDLVAKQTYGKFFRQLKSRNHELVFRLNKDRQVRLHQYGEFFYDNLIIMAPSIKKFGDGLGAKHIMKFIRSGRNVMIPLGSSPSEMLRKVAEECGIEVHPSGSRVYDHFNTNLAPGVQNNQQDMIASRNWADYPAIISEPPSAPVVFQGTAMSMKPNAHLVFDILRGSEFSYAQDAKAKTLAWGDNLLLVAALQTRKNARVTFAGSIKMFQDRFFRIPVQTSSERHDSSGNEKFIDQLGRWAFGQYGILRVGERTHFQVDTEALNPGEYTINQDVEYHFDLSHHKWQDDTWEPYEADDVDFEFVRLDPFIRRTMDHDGGGHYHIRFKLPHIFGVFKFSIKYTRKGWGFLDFHDMVSVRPHKHTEYDRFLLAAFPYYVGSFSMIVGFLAFTLLFLYGKRPGEKGKSKVS